MPQHVFDGMVSPVFNLGPGSLKWTWAKGCKAGDYDYAAQRLRVTGVTAQGRKLAGLVRRRKEEALLIQEGIYTGVTGDHRAAIWPLTSDAMSDGILERGERGKDVAKLIVSLHKLGFYDGVMDDVFGRGTQRAVLALQERESLIRDGRVGAQTFETIEKLLASPAGPKPPETCQTCGQQLLAA